VTEIDAIAEEIRIEMIGKNFGRLTVVSRADDGFYKKGGKVYPFRRWNSVCDCGGSATSYENGLKAGRSTSCGCKKRERYSEYGKNRKTHGLSHTKEDYARRAMLARCYSTKSAQYKNYGARGISVCDRWRESFENFVEDMGMAPSPSHSLDRIDVNGNYEKSNCRWATWKEQQRNRTNNHVIEIDGMKKSLAEWCEIYGVPQSRTCSRIARGISPLVALKREKLKPGPKNGRL
jgi:hypothetical protein